MFKQDYRQACWFTNEYFKDSTVCCFRQKFSHKDKKEKNIYKSYEE